MSEPLIAMFRVSTAKGGMRYGFCWIKKVREATDRVRKALGDGETLSAVWTCDWRKIPSEYKLVIGNSEDKKGPNLDMAADLRKQLFSKKDKRKRLRDRVMESINNAVALVKPEPKPARWCPFQVVVATPEDK